MNNKFTQFFAALDNFLAGKKTYIVAILGIVYLFGGDQGWWHVNDMVLGMFGFGGMAAIRAGIKKEN